MNPLLFLTDPVLRGPTIGSMLMCFAAALVGTLVFVRKRSLLGEALSHATYPGVTAAIILAGMLSLESSLSFLILLGAFFSALVGFWVIDRLEKKLKVAPDAALTVVLSLFFGIGVTIASYAQNSYATLYRQMQSYLYGQAATMTDLHVLIYGMLALLLLLFIALFYRKILALSFDPQFAYASGSGSRFLDLALFLIIVLSLVISLRCVGVVLMSAMLIAPAAAARQFTNRLYKMFVLSGIFGIFSAFLGIYSSVLLSGKSAEHYSLPSGPMIVLIASMIALFALFFAPRRGLISRYVRIVRFRGVCCKENLLKALWRLSKNGHEEINFKEIGERVGFSSLYLRFLLRYLVKQKALVKVGSYFRLTDLGIKHGARIVRLHRLWEVYLVNSLGLKVERVHKSAEEMEHILTPDLEKKLTELLDNPTQDPHEQPIPKLEEAHVL